MEPIDERVVEEVRKYDNLYNSSSKHYKDCRMARNSWREISRNTGLEVSECMKRWRNVRDKYVRIRKKLSSGGGDLDGQKVPALYHFLSWLEPHVKHRKKDFSYESTSSSSPVSRPSPVSRHKRKRDNDDAFARAVSSLEERRAELQQTLLQGTDECSRFGSTVADLLRRVPEDRRPDIMFQVYSLIHTNRQ